MAPNSHLCTFCGAETSAPRLPGSMWIAAALAIPFIVPGLIYAAWRFTTDRKLCPICSHNRLIPADAPLARTWRSAGWLAGQAPPGPTVSDVRIERIEQAIDAIALEVDRVTAAQRFGAAPPVNPRELGPHRP